MLLRGDVKINELRGQNTLTLNPSYAKLSKTFLFPNLESEDDNTSMEITLFHGVAQRFRYTNMVAVPYNYY